MERTVQKVKPPMVPPFLLWKKRVCAYTRISSGKDAMLHSLSAQVSHYNEFIQRHVDWDFCGVFVDEAVTGTKDDRKDFQRMLSKCRAGGIDMILTKSVTRFARNTVDLLKVTRELKSLGVDVFFEEENLHTLSANGEMVLTFLAAHAQEQSLSVSKDCKWRIQKNFQKGKGGFCVVYGYRVKHDRYTIIPEEAETVRMVFRDYLDGMGHNAIMKKLIRSGVPTRKGGQWTECTIAYMLQNEKYVGDLLLQKTFTTDHLTKQKKMNRGELGMYYIRDHHEAIVDRETFDRVQERIVLQRRRYGSDETTRGLHPFTGKMLCGQCWRPYERRMANAGTKYKRPAWICFSFNHHGKESCPSQQIPEDILVEATLAELGLTRFDRDMFDREIETILIPRPHTLVFVHRDGQERERTWKHRSRKWNDEGKELARRRYAEYLHQLEELT